MRRGRPCLAARAAWPATQPPHVLLSFPAYRLHVCWRTGVLSTTTTTTMMMNDDDDDADEYDDGDDASFATAMQMV